MVSLPPAAEAAANGQLRTANSPPEPVVTSPRAVAHASLLLATVLWGANFSAMHVLLAEVRPLDVLVVRTAIGAVSFALLLLARRQPLPAYSRAEWGRIALLGLLGVTIFNTAAAFGQQHLPASLSSLIVSSNPIFTAILAGLLGLELLTAPQVGGIALASLGLAVVVLGDTGGAAVDRSVIAGALILLLAPLSWSAYTILSKGLLRRHAAVPTAALGLIAGALLLTPVPFANPGMVGRLAGMSSLAWAAAFFGGLCSQLLAFICWNRGLRDLSPSQAAVYGYLTPVFGLLFAWLLLGEAPTFSLLVGGAAILAGVVLTNRRPRPAPEVSELLGAAPEP